MSLRSALLILILCVCVFPHQSLGQNFAPAVNFSTQQNLAEAIAEGDFDSDGNLDVIVANSGASSLSFFRGQGDGIFATPVTIPLTSDPNAQPAAVAAADFNGDGHLDLAVSFSLSSSIQVMLGNGDGTFQAPVSLAIPSLGQFPIVIQLTSVDLNGDRIPDLAAATSNGVAIFLNDGAGNFTLHTNVFPGQIIQNFVVADFNRDQLPDIAATAVSGTGIITGAVYLSFGNGDGTFQLPEPLPLTTNVPSGIAAGDLNGDGLPDLVVSDFGSVNLMTPANGGVTVALQHADGTFQSSATLPGLTRPGAVTVADFDGDGNQDVAVLSGSSAAGQPVAVLVYLGQGNGAFSTPNQFPVLPAPVAFVTGSFTNTNALDIVTADLTANAISVLVNRGAVSMQLSSSINPALISQPVILTATVVPRFAGTGTPSGSVIFADGANTIGVASVNPSRNATITANFSSPGTHSITAVYGGNSTFVGGASARLNQVVSQAQPSITLSSSLNPSQVGQPVTFTVTVSAVGAGPVPTGNVSLSSAGVVILGGTLDSTGRIALTTSSLTAGSNIITAQYAGDANYEPRTSSALTQTVNLNPDTTTLTVAPNPSAFGQAVSLSATVTASSGASATPSGAVTFTDSGNVLGTATLDNAGAATLTPSSLSPGIHSIVAVYGGDTKFSSSTSAAIALTVNKAATATTLSGSPNPSVFGQAVVFSATVTGPANAGTATGVVTFSDGANTIGTASLNQGKATLGLNSLAVGAHNITASYPGDATFASSASAAISQTVNKSSSTTTLAGIPNPSVFGQPVALTAKVATAGGSGTPTGIVTFSDGTVSLGTATLTQGKAALTITSLAPGTHTISAAYAGDADFLPSSAAGAAGVTQVVSQSSTITDLTSSVNPSVYGQAVTFTAVVAATGGGGGIPSGTLTFRDGTNLLGTAILDNTGKGSISVSSMGAGSHSISASYSGSTGYLASVFAALSQVTNRDPVVVTLTSVPSPSTVGQAIAVNVQVAPAAPGGGAGAVAPAGSIIINDATTLVGTVTLDIAGKAAVSISNLVAGSHNLTAVYQGDTNYSAGVSGPLTQVVNKLSTSVTLTSSLNPTTNASALSLTATVRSSSTGVPTGAVTLLDGAQQVSSAAVTSGGSVTFPLSNLPSGSHGFTATYAGDSTFAASQSAPLNEAVVDSHSKVALTSSANPVTVSAAVTFVAAVTPALGGSANGGAVVFSNGNQTLATLPVTSSRAVFTTTSLPVGQDQIIASYQAASSPGPFDGTSPVLVETVNPGKPDFSLSIQPTTGQINAGGIFQAKLTLIPLNGLTGPETTLCSGAPAGSSCTVTPHAGVFDGKTTLTATIIVSTTAPQRDFIGSPERNAKPRPPVQGLVLGLLPIAFGGVLIYSRPRKRHGFLALVMLAGLLTGCGSGSSYSPPKPVRTPPGAYTLSIRSQSGSLVHTGSIKLTVK